MGKTSSCNYAQAQRGTLGVLEPCAASVMTKCFFNLNPNKNVFFYNLDLCQSLGAYDWQLRGFTNLALGVPCVYPERTANRNAELTIACCILPVAHGLPPNVY